MSKQGDKLFGVVSAKDRTPYAMIDGQRVKTKESTLALQPAPAYQKGFVQIDGWSIESHINASEHMVDASPNVQKFGGFIHETGSTWRAKLSADRDLHDCYFAFRASGQRDIAIFALPDLRAGEVKSIDGYFQPGELSQRLSIYFFSGGVEYLHSMMDAEFIRVQQQKTDDFILKNSADTGPRPVGLVAPTYPTTLTDKKEVGSAKIFCRVGAAGEIMEVAVREASRSEFGEAAVAAVRQWRFSPAIKNHTFAKSSVLIPIEFKPPATEKVPKR